MHKTYYDLDTLSFFQVGSLGEEYMSVELILLSINKKQTNNKQTTFISCLDANGQRCLKICSGLLIGWVTHPWWKCLVRLSSAICLFACCLFVCLFNVWNLKRQKVYSKRSYTKEMKKKIFISLIKIWHQGTQVLFWKKRCPLPWSKKLFIIFTQSDSGTAWGEYPTIEIGFVLIIQEIVLNPKRSFPKDIQQTKHGVGFCYCSFMRNVQSSGDCTFRMKLQ